MNQTSLEFHPISKLKKRLNSVRTMRNECFIKIKKLLTLLLQEDDRICRCALEEEELTEEIDRCKNGKI